MGNSKEDNLKEIVIDYFRALDSGNFGENHLALFSDDFLLEFSKFGSKKGLAALNEFGTKVGAYYKNMQHHIDSNNVVVAGNRVFAEGFLSGETIDGNKWPDHKTSFGKFCTVFEFADGKIIRMSIYSDPDFASEDKERIALFG